MMQWHYLQEQFRRGNAPVGANWDDRLAGRVCDQAESFSRAFFAVALLCAAERLR